MRHVGWAAADCWILKRQHHWYLTLVVSPAEQGTGNIIITSQRSSHHHLKSSVTSTWQQILISPTLLRILWWLSLSCHDKRNRSESKNQLFNCTPWYLWFDMNSATFKVWPKPIISQQKNKWQEYQANSQSSTIQDWRHFCIQSIKIESQSPKWQDNHTRPRKKAFKRPTHRTRCLLLFWMGYGCLHVWVLAADLEPHTTILHRFSATWRPPMRSRR